MMEKLNRKVFWGFFLVIQILITCEITNAEYYDYDVPYINQLDYPDWGQSACGPTSITMILRYWYPNSLIDVPVVYHAATQGKKGYPIAYYQDENTGAPLPGYFNVGYATEIVWPGTDPDTATNRVPEEFRDFYHNDYSGMVKEYAVRYLENIWGANVNIVNQTMDNIINEIRSRPIIINVDEGWGGHFIVLRGYNDEDDSFYINDPYPPYADRGTGPFDTATTEARNRKISYATLQTWITGRKMLTFQPNSSHTDEVRRYTTIVDNGIGNWGDAGILNQNCNADNHCFEVDNINERTSTGEYVWLSWHAEGKDWIYPRENGHWVRWRPSLQRSGTYELFVKFYGSSSQSNVKYSIYNASGLKIVSTQINQTEEGFESVSLGRYSLTNGAYVQADDIPKNCRADSIMFLYIPEVDEIDLNGVWEGTWFQNSGGVASEYNGKMVLTQNGTDITGTSRIELINEPQYYGLMNISGSLDGSAFTFQETELVEDNSKSSFFWCIKTGTLSLSYSDGIKKLTGNWSAPSCRPGSVTMEFVEPPIDDSDEANDDNAEKNSTNGPSDNNSCFINILKCSMLKSGN